MQPEQSEAERLRRIKLLRWLRACVFPLRFSWDSANIFKVFYNFVLEADGGAMPQ